MPCYAAQDDHLRGHNYFWEGRMMSIRAKLARASKRPEARDLQSSKEIAEAFNAVLMNPRIPPRSKLARLRLLVERGMKVMEARHD